MRYQNRDYEDITRCSAGHVQFGPISAKEKSGSIMEARRNRVAWMRACRNLVRIKLDPRKGVFAEDLSSCEIGMREIRASQSHIGKPRSREIA